MDSGPVSGEGPRAGSRLLVNTAYRATADVGSKLASLALYLVMARELGDEGFGIFTFGLAYMTLFTALAHFGQDPVLTREVARERSALPRYLGNVLALKSILAVPAAALAVAALVVAGTDATTVTVCVVLGAAVSAEALMQTSFGVYQAFDRMKFIPVVLITQRFVTAIVGIAVLLGGAGVVAAAVVYLAGALLALVLAFVLQARRVSGFPVRVDPGAWRTLMRAAIPIGIAGIFGTLVFRADMVMLAGFESDAVVGDYGAAYRLFETTLFLSWSVGSAAYPVFATLTELDELRDMLERATKLAAILSFPLAAGAAVAGPAVIDLLYGDEFSEAGGALRLLAPAIALFPLGYVTSLLLVAQGRQRELAILYGLVLVENVLLNLVLIPAFSLDGAALGTSISEAFIAAGSLALAVRLTAQPEWRRILGGPLIASLAALAAMVSLREDALLSILLGGAVYAAALALAERLTYPEDLRAARAFLGRGSAA